MFDAPLCEQVRAGHKLLAALGMGGWLTTLAWAATLAALRALAPALTLRWLLAGSHMRRPHVRERLAVVRFQFELKFPPCQLGGQLCWIGHCWSS